MGWENFKVRAVLLGRGVAAGVGSSEIGLAAARPLTWTRLQLARPNSSLHQRYAMLTP